MRKKYRITKVLKKDRENFHGFYKKHEIIISLDFAHHFYIRVTDKDGCFLYDGYYESLNVSINDAIHESLTGSKLVEDEDEKTENK